MNMGLLVALENVNKHLSDKSSGFLTLDHNMGTPPPLKIKILKSGFLHAREDQKIGLGPNFHEPRSSND